jgi:hypothetical protein
MVFVSLNHNNVAVLTLGRRANLWPYSSPTPWGWDGFLFFRREEIMHVSIDMGLIFKNFLERLLNAGFEVPIHVLTVGSNSHIMAGRLDDLTAMEGLRYTELTSYSPEEGKIKLTVNIILIDSNGRAARCLMAEENEEPQVTVLN